MMKYTARVLAMAAVLVAGVALAGAAKVPTYILGGYRFEGLLGPANSSALAAKLKDQPGARVHKADIKADVGILAKELHAQHIRGRLYTGLIVGGGHIWVIFHLADEGPQDASGWTSRRLVTQRFEVASGIPGSNLAAATGLKPGDLLSRERIVAARKGLSAVLAKLRPGKFTSIQVRIETKPPNEASLSWIIGEQVRSH